MATFTIGDVVADLRLAVQDTDSSIYRYSDAHLTRIVNQALQRICLMRPDLFAKITTITLVAGREQSAPVDSVRIIDLLGTPAGASTSEINQDSLDLMFPLWEQTAAGTAQSWMRKVRNPNGFSVYPVSVAGQQLLIEYSQSPPTYDMVTQIALLPNAHFVSVLDASIWLVESVDNEHVSSGRAKMFQESFVQGLGLTAQNKPVTDTISGGADPKTVV